MLAIRRIPIVPVVAFVGLVAGVMAGLMADGTYAGVLARLFREPPSVRQVVWMMALMFTGAPVVWGTVRGLLRGHFAADVVATLAIVGAVLLGQPLAGLVVVIMQTGGEALEQWAVRRASNAVAALEADAPRTAQRISSTGTMEELPVEQIAVGDTLLVRPGMLFPCDSTVLAGTSLVDTSRLTGEPIPVAAMAGTPFPSGAVNGDGALTVRAERVASESQYARIVELVRSAQASKSPLQREADRWAVWFTPFTLLACLLAWLVSGDFLRVLAVLVVATPCPLILATPVAVIAGISRAARRGIILRNGGALEALTKVSVVAFDKTGTLTVGRPQVATVVTDQRELLSVAAAVEQHSSHLLGRVVVEYATERGITIPSATDVQESAGRGVSGRVDGVDVTVGSASLIAERFPALASRVHAFNATNGVHAMHAFVATSTGAFGRIEFEDVLRPDVGELLAALEARGITRTLLLSGDQSANVAGIATALGISEYAGDLRPADKAARIRAIQEAGARVLMVGDGTNDAPALSTASVGVALAGHGGGVSAEAADIVLLVDEPKRIIDALDIARDSMRIARQSIAVGLGLSVIGMGFAGAGWLQPTAGAVLQEVIDVAVIINALRAARETRA